MQSLPVVVTVHSLIFHESCLIAHILTTALWHLQRGKFPIVVGGTGLYLRWLVQGRPQTPKSDAEMAGKAQQALDKVSQHRLMLNILWSLRHFPHTYKLP